MRTSLVKTLISAVVITVITSAGHAHDLPTTTAHIKRIQKEIATIKARQKKEADLMKWYRQKEAALAKQRQKPWQIIPSSEERKHARAAEAIAELIEQDDEVIENYETSIRRYAWAYVVVYDYEANKNYRVAKNLVPYIEEGNQILEDISKAQDEINNAQMTETMSFVGNIYGARSGAVYSKMGSKATIKARQLAQDTINKAAIYFAKIKAGGKTAIASTTSSQIEKNGPAFNPAAKSVNSAIAIENLSEAYTQLSNASDNIDIIVTSLVDSVHMLEDKNEKIAVKLANKILSQNIAQ